MTRLVFHALNSFSISAAEAPLETFIKPKNVLDSAPWLEPEVLWMISEAAPHRLMALGALAGSEPMSSSITSEAGSRSNVPRRM